MHCCNKIISQKRFLVPPKTGYLTTKKSKNCYPKTCNELLKVPIIPPMSVELRSEVFARLCHCGPRYCKVTLQSLLRPLWTVGSKPSTSGLGTTVPSKCIYYDRIICKTTWKFCTHVKTVTSETSQKYQATTKTIFF